MVTLVLVVQTPAQSEATGYVEIEVPLDPASAIEVGLESFLDDDLLGHDHSEPSFTLLVSDVTEAEFDLIGFLWSADTVDLLYVRTKSSTGNWSDWVQLGIHIDDEGPRQGSDPYWAPGAVAFQVAIEGVPQGFAAGMVQTDQPQEAAPLALESTEATGPAGVHARSEWDAGNDCRPEGEPVTYSDVQGIVVHHTVSAASSQAAVPAAIDAICNFHVNGRGWSDIGYNAVIDPWGGIWEGRTGGLEDGISGAHAAGFNTSTQGIAMLGDYSNNVFATAQEDALVYLLDWMTGWYLVDPDADVTLYSRSDGPQFSEGESVTLPSIMGHRDLGTTSCPGDAGYSRLPSIRSEVVPVPRTVGTSGGDELLTYNTVNGRLRYESITASGSYSMPVRWGWVSPGWTSVEAIELTSGGNNEIQFYNSETGTLVFHELNADGSLGPLIRHGTIGEGWTTMEPADTDSDANDEMFFYRRSDGRFAFYQVEPSGLLGSGIRSGFFGKGWTAVEPIDLDGDGKDEMFFYRSSDGRFAFYELTADGFIGSAIRVSNFGLGWDTVEPINTDGVGGDELLFYRISDGRYAYYNVDAAGFVGANLSVGNYPDQWTSISSPELD